FIPMIIGFIVQLIPIGFIGTIIILPVTFFFYIKFQIMTKEEVYRFVMHYERLTHYILEEMPSFSDMVLERDEEFNFSIIKTP
ncbi:MAG: hypothetical protein ABGX42_06445, partial [Gammaproteobacteria bacterium]